jgi:hypothetical protein
MPPEPTGRRRWRMAGVALLATLTLLALQGAALAAAGEGATGGDDGRRVRFATFNASLNRAAEGQLISTCPPPTTSRPRMPPRPSSGSAPTCC